MKLFHVRRPSPRRQLRRGGSLILVTITTVVVATLVFAMLTSSMSNARGMTGTMEQSSAWYAARGAIWACANSLSAGNTGDIAGDVVTGTYADQSGLSDSDGDGYLDFSSRDYFLASARPDGYFEARAIDLGSGTSYEVVTRGVSGGTVWEATAILKSEGDFHPFAFGMFSEGDIDFVAHPFSDSYTSENGTGKGYFTQGTSDSSWGSTVIRNGAGSEGNIGANGDITIGEKGEFNGDVNPGPSGSISMKSGVKINGDTSQLSETRTNPVPSWNVPSAGDSKTISGVAYGGTLSSSGLTIFNQPGKYVFDKIKLTNNKAEIRFTGGPNDVYEIYVTNTGLSMELMAGTINVGQPGNDDNNSQHPTIKIYNAGRLLMNENGQINAGDVSTGSPSQDWAGVPSHFQYYSNSTSMGTEPGKAAVYLNGYSEISGVWYLPTGSFVMSEDPHLWGAVVAGYIEMGEDAAFSYDEALGNMTMDGGDPLFVPQIIRRRD